jgi:hypothetical protein
MTNKDIYKCLIKPNAEIIVIPSDSDRRNRLCLKANGIIAKKNNLNEIIVVESINPIILIGFVILYINGIYCDNIKTVDISKALLYRSCNIIYEFDVIQKCLQANSIYASRKGQNNILIVTHSSRSNIPIGTVVVSIDSKDVHKLCNETIAQLLQQPNRSFEFDIDIIKKCLQANSIYATQEGQNNKLIVTHSNRSDIPIGTVVVSIDSKDVHSLCNETIAQLLQQPNRSFEFENEII